MKKTTMVLAAAILAVGCSNKGGGAAPTADTSKPAPAKAGVDQTTPSPAKPAAAAQGYALDGIKTIPDSCASAHVILSTAPASVGADHPWQTARQALLANQQFKVVDGEPAAPGQVHLGTFDSNGSFALVAACKDGGTCNQLAAMYKALIRSSHPQVICGHVPGMSAEPVGAFSFGAAQQNLPTSGDAIAACARLDACMIATDRSTPGDPFLECQKAPSSFKLRCAEKYPCAEVMACLGK